MHLLLFILSYFCIQKVWSMEPKIGFVNSGKFKLGYRIEGEGVPALVLGSATYYSRIFSQNLRNHLKLYFIDNRAWVESPGDVDLSEYTLEVIMEDIELMRKSLGIEKAVMIGHSGHVFMALEYAKKYPQHVSHLVLIGAGPNFSDKSTQECEQYWADSLWPERKAALERNFKQITDEHLNSLPADQRWIKNYIRLAPRIWYDYNFNAEFLWKDVAMNMPAFSYIWTNIFKNIDITMGIERVSMPVYLALGRYDFIVAPPASWNPIRPLFKDISLHVYEQSGHTPQYEQPELFDNQLLIWLKHKK